MTDAGGLRGKSVALIGAGNMGLALLEGWAAQDLLGAVSIVEPQPSQRLQDLCAAQGYGLNGAAAPRDAVVLAVKPQALESGAAAAVPFVARDTVVVSILAGKRTADVAARLPTQAVVRAMPNTPAAIGRGVTGAFASAATSAPQRAFSDALLSAVGGVEWVEDEALIDVVTAVSGSGPAYVFYFAECLAAAGAEAGLPAALAARLARATVEGAGELMRRQPETGPDELRRRVTSPGGTTAAALEVLEAPEGLAALMRRAVAAAKRRAGELSG